MTLKSFTLVRTATAFVLAITISLFIVRGNFYLPLAAMAAAVVVLLFAKSKVKDVLYDERDLLLAGKAAMYSIKIYGLLAASLVMVLLALKKGDPVWEPVGSALAYSVCFLLVLYSLFYKFLARK
ncbi:MAG: DUF2178 domain-containing protein [Patescibacteria group bacterium]|jgi:uncharacterized membrane protein